MVLVPTFGSEDIRGYSEYRDFSLVFVFVIVFVFVFVKISPPVRFEDIGG